ncbi:helix-turn-helix domain-containing protein, partial [Lacticaseibacillus paracasei]
MFGERLTQLRKQKGLSQNDLAEAIGISRQAISKY